MRLLGWFCLIGWRRLYQAKAGTIPAISPFSVVTVTYSNQQDDTLSIGSLPVESTLETTPSCGHDFVRDPNGLAEGTPQKNVGGVG